MGYTRPVNAPITDDWAEHIARGSGEPGTDYACSYGTPVRAAGNGTVTSVKHDNTGGMGRYVQYLLDDGRETRSIHLSEVWASVSQRVVEGDFIGLSGASGYNSDWYYGPHVHKTLWPGSAWDAHTIDFELYVGSDPQPVMKEANVFIAIRKSSWYLILPAENGKLYAQVLGGQDKIGPIPTIEYVWDASWEQLKVRLVNPNNVPD